MATKQEDTSSLVEAFLARGGEITRLPYRAPHFQRKPNDGRVKESTFNPRAEAKKLEEVGAKRYATLENYRRAKMIGEIPKDATPPPWEE